MKKKSLTIQLTEVEHKRIKILAIQHGLSMKELILLAINEKYGRVRK